MQSTIKKTLFNIGGYSFWILLVCWGVLSLILKSCQTLCHHTVVNTVSSPNGEQVAEISIGDCGGATTDFFGSVDVKSNKQILPPANSDGCDINPLRGFPR
tara:strand:+ start:4240 stop:4542 length:303 start_codon:yes stop_codon:yes gene_type:complete